MSNSHYKLLCFFVCLYFILISVFLAINKMFFSPDQFFFVALIAVLFLGKWKQFIRDWSFPAVLFLSYDYMRGLVPDLTLKAHIMPMILFDQFLFSTVPTLTLQSFLFDGKTLHWYDYVAAVLYLSHFIIPMMIGFTFWLLDKDSFKKYFGSLLLLSYLAFFTYILFPATPPWLAAQNGYLPPVHKILDQVFSTFPGNIHLPSVYQLFGANLVAAVPSLHAAYPFLSFLFLRRKLKKLSYLLLPYVFGMWFSIVYLGEHYVFDIVIAIIYAYSTYLLVTKGRFLLNLISKVLQQHLIKQQLPFFQLILRNK